VDNDRDYPARPLVGVGAVIFRGEQILLVQRGKEPSKGIWTIPGGMVELGETVREAILREVEEETCLSVEVLGVADVIDAIRTDGDGRIRTHYVLIDFVTRHLSGEAVAATDVDGVKWIHPSSLHEYEPTERLVEVVEKAWLIAHPDLPPLDLRGRTVAR
jgi:ADP-ribose pyrophosphatase YjhB (NUDIX family)